MIQIFTSEDAYQAALPTLPVHTTWYDGAQIVVRTAPDIVADSSRVIEAYEFRNRFTQAQQLAVMQAAFDNKDTVMRLTLMDLWTATQGVDLDGDKVRQGLAHCVQSGILTQADADAITA